MPYWRMYCHLIWTTKNRHPLLTGKVANTVEASLRAIVEAMHVLLHTLFLMPDHVHLFIATDPTHAPQFLANQFKGYTSRVLRQEFAHLRSQLPSLWTRSYFCGSAGTVTAATIRRYIEQQKTRS